MEEFETTKRPEPRSQEEIFADLRTLAQSEGALHEISALIFRDWLVTYDVQDKRVADDPEQRWSNKKINKNELMLLVGLLVQATDDRSYAVVSQNSDFASRADLLLREFHDHVLSDVMPVYDHDTQTYSFGENSIGPLAREAIYYGADSFYLHQLFKFSRMRYREDMEWLLQNVGVSIRPIIEMTKYIVDQVNARMSAVGGMRKEGHTFGNYILDVASA